MTGSGRDLLPCSRPLVLPVSYSAFRGELNANDRAVLAKRVSQFVNDEHDSIFIIPLCDPCTGTAEIISNSGACLVKDSSVQIV